jgi:hypothetical protein
MLKADQIHELHETLYSGDWQGFYIQIGCKFPQRQRMEFADGIVRGEGADGIGTFVIEGEYRSAGPRDLRIGWIKTYSQAHSVLYLGSFDGERIRGKWEIGGWGDQFEFRPEPHDSSTTNIAEQGKKPSK